MRVNTIQSNYGVYGANRNVKSSGVKSVNSSISAQQTGRMVQLTFTGAGLNVNQVASLTPENTGLGLPEAAQGGEGVVGFELPASLRKHENVDARSFMPFWEYNNPNGGYKFLIHKESEFPKGVAELPDTMPAKAFMSAAPGQTLEDVAKALHLKTSELSYVIQSKPNGNGPNSQSKYCILEPTSVKGEITRMADETLGDVKKVPYALLKISEHNPSYNKLKGQPHYFLYTPELARTAKPYSYDANGNGSFDAEIINSDSMRAHVDLIHSKMNTEEFGYYRPANVICHDRVMNSYVLHMANASAAGKTDVDGVKAHVIVHNSGRNYQGTTDDPFKMLTLVADETDMAKLKAMPEFPILEKAKRYGIYNSQALSPREQNITWSILEPYLRPFRDAAGTYNILKIGIAGAAANPNNISVGTVSHTFDHEMRHSEETPDAAKFLDYNSVETKSVLNGVTPANMQFDVQTAKWGRGDNGLTKAVDGFTPFKYDGTNIEEVIAAREKNAKWLSNLIWEAGEKGQDELNRLFFNEGQIMAGHNVLGHIAPIKDGDIQVFGFGRPDEQKGFPITLKGFLEFLKMDDVSKEDKLRFRNIIGAGPWDKNADDYKDIVKYAKEIWELDGGAYRNTLMYIDGYTPNRITGCSHFGMFTSRREMCGITPIECKIAGTPYGTTKTGGPVDYTNAKNGYLTKEAVELAPEYYGLSWSNSAKEIDDARIDAQAHQVAQMYKEMLHDYVYDHDSYVAKCKKNIEELVDWHNNGEYNGGVSANKAYMNGIFEADKGAEARSMTPMRRLAGAFGKFQEDSTTVIVSLRKTKPIKYVLAFMGGVAAVAGSVILYKNFHKNSNPKTKQMDKVA